MAQIGQLEIKDFDTVIEDGRKYAAKEFKLEMSSKPVGKGNYGRVFMAFDQNRVKHAVKICVKPENGTSAQLEEYLEREINVQKDLNHPNVVKLFNGVSCPDFTILDMEFCDMTLEAYITEVTPEGRRRYRSISEKEFCPIAKQCTRGINALHSAGVVHRDIKLENVMVVQNGDGSLIFKLADLGLAKKEADIVRTQLGTPIYEAPEVFHANIFGQYTNRCDLWSLGIMYYILLSSRVPFCCSSREEIGKNLLAPDPAVYSLPQDLDKLSDCCRNFVRSHLFRDPNKRTTAEEAMKHPFVTPAINLIPAMNTLKSDYLTLGMVYSLEIGNHIFIEASKILKDDVKKPHALYDFQKANPIRPDWGTLVKQLPDQQMRDPAVLEDMRIICNDGMCCTKDDHLVMNGDEMHAIMVSLKNGLTSENVVGKVGRMFREDQFKELNLTDSTSIKAPFDLFVEYFKSCRFMVQQYRNIAQTLETIESFRSKVLNPNAQWEKSRTLLQEVRKKCPSFPNIGFCKPASTPYQQLASFDQWQAETDVLENNITKIKERAQIKFNSKKFDYREEINEILAMWEKYKGFQQICKKKLDSACETINMVLQTFQADVKVILNLERLIQILRKAVEASDASVVYPDLLPIVKCEYLLLDDSDMVMLTQAAGEKDELAGGEKNSMDAYLEDLRKRLNTLCTSCVLLARERDRLNEETQFITDQSIRAGESYNKLISELRAQLEAHKIFDPTAELVK